MHVAALLNYSVLKWSKLLSVLIFAVGTVCVLDVMCLCDRNRDCVQSASAARVS